MEVLIGAHLRNHSAITLIGVAIGAILLQSTVSLTLLGVALTNTLELSNFMQWTVRQVRPSDLFRFVSPRGLNC